MRKFTKRSAAILGATVVAVGAGAAAWAGGWLVNGTGTASATASKVNNMNADITLNDKIFPERVLTATAKVDNPNDFPANLTALTGGTVNSTRGGAVNTACNTKLTQLGLNAITPSLPATGSTKIAAGAVDQEISMGLTISTNFPIECQDSLITASITFTGNSTV